MTQEKETRQSPHSWKTLSIVAIAGVALSVILFIGYHRLTRQAKKPDTSNSANLALSQPLAPLSAPSPEASAVPTSEPSVAPVAKASPSARATTSPGRLSSSPVSTTPDERAKQGVIIRLNRGGSIAADEAWRTKEGIWYRRNGVVTLLKRARVIAIERLP